MITSWQVSIKVQRIILVLLGVLFSSVIITLPIYQNQSYLFSGDWNSILGQISMCLLVDVSAFVSTTVISGVLLFVYEEKTPKWHKAMFVCIWLYSIVAPYYFITTPITDVIFWLIQYIVSFWIIFLSLNIATAVIGLCIGGVYFICSGVYSSIVYDPERSKS